MRTSAITYTFLFGGLSPSIGLPRIFWNFALSQRKSSGGVVRVKTGISSTTIDAHTTVAPSHILSVGNETNTNKTMKLAMYSDPNDPELTVWGLNVCQSKFCAYVNHTLASRSAKFQNEYITTSSIMIENEGTRGELRRLWKEGRLISERTEPLATYMSDKDSTVEASDISEVKRGGFPDMISVYNDRMMSILHSEKEERDSDVLWRWMNSEYGEEETKRLQADVLRSMGSEEEQISELKHFLEFFRARFPYYYDRCSHCGASAKDDTSHIADGSSTEEEDESHFVGYVYPSSTEREGNAGRTEIYLCKHCHGFTRFPRYNSVASIIKNRRGRCGEYAMLLFRLLRVLGHEARWVVDWSDHVWADVLLSHNDETLDSNNRRTARWVHLDPCEAAVDEPLLYQGWGKKQTYIMAFYSPNIFCSNADGVTNGLSLDSAFIEDVTEMYTSDNIEEINKRREESDECIHNALAQQIERLQQNTTKAAATTAL
mmetsp:Transcript_11378/g.17080  ORF Transcript_11378/g.17080 Transcript_11378/m.17080 type:complete len:488 (+) Transcript_11378:2949-4412(+)